MGAMLVVRCASCDYSDQLMIGSGMSMVVLEPMLCRPCARVRSVTTSPPRDPDTLEPLEGDDELNICPSCRSPEVEPWGSEPEPPLRQPAESRAEALANELRRESSEPEWLPGPCPNCSAPTSLSFDGLWD